HHPDDTLDASLQSCRIVDAAEIAINNEVAAVGDKRHGRRHADASAGAEHLERLAGCFQSEGDHLHGKRRVATKSVHHLAAVDDYHEAMARGRDNLLAQQGSAQSLDQIEGPALDFVSTIDREINPAMLAERGQRNTQSLSLYCRTLRRGNPDKTQALLMPPRERFDRESRR